MLGVVRNPCFSLGVVLGLTILFFSGTQSSILGVMAIDDNVGGAHENDETTLPVWAQLTLAFFLVCLSAVLAGLTIGIMGLDTLSLEIIATSGSEPDRSYAQKLLPIRKMGHQALCTMLLGNMWANVMIAEFCADVNPEGGGEGGEGEEGASGIVGFLLSTLIILIFAEIVPMSICKGSNALKIAAGGIPILKVFLVLLWPVAWPLGKLLDKLIHHDVGQVYDRNELKKLMSVHFETFGEQSGLQRTELNMMLGAMEFHEVSVRNIMRPLDRVFMIEENVRLDDDVLNEIWEKGHSRVPICQHGNRQSVLGVLFAKDLLMLKSEKTKKKKHQGGGESPLSPMKRANSTVSVGGGDAELPPTAGEFVMRTQSRGVCTVGEHLKLPAMLAQLQSGRAHLFFVHEVSQAGEGEFPMADGVKLSESFTKTTVAAPAGSASAPSPTTMTQKLLGIVTLEDIIEKLIGSDILDEDDGNKRKRVNFHDFAVDEANKHSTGLSDAELSSVSNFLRTSCQDSFAHYDRELLKDGLREFATVRDIIPNAHVMTSGPSSREASPTPQADTRREDSPSAEEKEEQNMCLYSRGVGSDVFTLVLAGQVEVTLQAGSEKFKTSYKRFSWLGEPALHSGDFASKVTAVVVAPTKVLEIRRKNYVALEKSLSMA